LWWAIVAENLTPESSDAGEATRHRHDGSSVTLSNNFSTDSAPAPRLQRSKSCSQGPPLPSSEPRRRFFLPSIDPSGSVSAQRRRPATSDGRGPPSEDDDATEVVQRRPPRSTAVWNSSAADQPVTATRFLPTPPPPRNNSTGNI